MNDEKARFQTYPKHLCRIVLVHGTWPAGFWRRPPPPPKDPSRPGRFMPKRRWYERDSSFRSNLRTNFLLHDVAYVFYPFVWSGRNSVFARDEAAKSLAKLLTDALEAFPEDDFVIIAHSHGGNTALRALHYIGDQAKRVFLITIATPFLQIYVSPKLTRHQPIDSVVFMVSLMAILNGWLAQHEGIAALLSNWWGAIGLILVCSIASAFLAFFLYSPEDFGTRWCKRPAKIADAAFYDLRKTPPARLLVLRAFDDEAALSLAAGAVATRIANLLAGKILFYPYLFIVLVSFLLPALIPSLSDWAWSPSAILRLIRESMYLGLAALTIGIMGPMLKGVFGRELFLGAARCEISAESAPDISDRVDVTTLNPCIFTDMIRRRHALYDNEACRNAISEWIWRVVRPPISMVPYNEIDGQDWIAAHRSFFPSRGGRNPGKGLT